MTNVGELFSQLGLSDRKPARETANTFSQQKGVRNPKVARVCAHCSWCDFARKAVTLRTCVQKETRLARAGTGHVMDMLQRVDGSGRREGWVCILLQSDQDDASIRMSCTQRRVGKQSQQQGVELSQIILPFFQVASWVCPEILTSKCFFKTILKGIVIKAKRVEKRKERRVETKSKCRRGGESLGVSMAISSPNTGRLLVLAWLPDRVLRQCPRSMMYGLGFTGW